MTTAKATLASHSIRSNGRTNRRDVHGTPGSAKNAMPKAKQEEYQAAHARLASVGQVATAIT